MNSTREELGTLIRLTRQYIEKEYGITAPETKVKPLSPKEAPRPAPVKRVVPPPTPSPLVDEKPMGVDVKDQLATLKNLYPALKMVETIPTKNSVLLVAREEHPFFVKIAAALETRGIPTTLSHSLKDLEGDFSLYLIEKPLSITKKPVIYLETASVYEERLELKKALWEQLKTALRL